MPELPEVETIRRDLAAALEGATIARARLFHDDLLLDGGPTEPFVAALAGRRIEAIHRRGKNLVFRLAPGGDVLQAQVRMTGRFAVAPSDDPRGAGLRELIGFTHVAADFELADGRTLLYDDVRRLGGFRLQPGAEWAARETELGPEPLADDYRTADLAAALAGSRAPVKNALLDQRRVAGIGNIYASEVLFRARIDPRRASGDLTDGEYRRLYRALRAVLRAALKGEGTTLSDYRAVDGRSGRFQERLRAYGREGKPCPRCGTPIERIVQAGRSTFFCPFCQT
jgi:formamidopyrimidine-DNA glycosylase